MTDRELLIHAARAAGIETEGHYVNGRLFVSHSEDLWEFWAPLNDDGDALRLAVSLGIFSTTEQFQAFQGYYSDEIRRDNQPTAATRRAIVVIAAEIGRTK